MPNEPDANLMTGADAEIKSMNAIVDALKPLTEEERRRVLEYVLRRFGALPIQESIPSIPSATPSPGITGVPHHGSARPIQDIRSLKEEKSPKSANEMAALVAFYLSELAPEHERKTTIAKGDIERYFKSAGFSLPADASFTLVNAKNAGYLDNAGGGQYKLNPVGYNLVAYRMGQREKGKTRKAHRGRAKRGANKTTNSRGKK